MKTGCFKVKTATELMMNAHSYASEFSETATADKDGTVHFGKWAVTRTGDMTYDNWYNIEDCRLTEDDWIHQMFSKGWIDWNEFIPAYWHALRITGKTHIKARVYFK